MEAGAAVLAQDAGTAGSEASEEDQVCPLLLLLPHCRWATQPLASAESVELDSRIGIAEQLLALHRGSVWLA